LPGPVSLQQSRQAHGTRFAIPPPRPRR
jgi:hypothetical protein